MNRISNFKVNFSKILSDKYHFTEEGINKYWENKEKEESFERKQFIGMMVGLGELVTSASLCYFYPFNEEYYIIPVLILGGVGALTAKVSVVKKNPYTLKEYYRMDKNYKEQKEKYKNKK